jgi:hypothetical protein
MKRLFLALLVAMVAPAFAQEMTYTDPTQIPTVEQTYTFIQQQTATPIQDVRDEGGTALTLYDDGVSQAISLGFDFYYYGNLYDSVFVSQNGFISFTSQANGCCGGIPLPSITEWTQENASFFQYYNTHNSIFAMWSDLADFEFGNPYYKSTGSSFIVGWYGVDELGSAPYTCDETGCFSSGPGNKFTFEISLFSDSSFSINYGAFDYNNQTGRTFTSGYQGDQSTEFYQIYYGNDPSSLQNTTYFVQSSEIVPTSQPEEPIAPDCNINPTNPTCIINSIIDDQEETYLADENFGSDDGSNFIDDEQDSVEEETFFAAEELAQEETFIEEPESLEEMLADDSADETLDDSGETLVAKELNDEQKSNALADSIATNVLEAALAIAADATSAAGGSGEGSSQSSSSSNKETLIAGSAAEVMQDSSNISSSTSDSTDSSGFDSSGDAALDILETGRAMGQEALAATMSQTETSAAESINEASSVAAASVAETESSIQTLVAVDSSQSDTIEDSQQQMNQQFQETVEDVTSIEMMVADTSQQDIQIIEEQAAFEQVTEQVMVAEEQQTEIFTAQQEVQSSVDYTDMSSVMENFMAATDPQAAEQQELENNIIQQAIASSQQSEDNNSMGFAEAEAMTIINDPALANAFNVQPNTANLELLGVLGSAGQDKSDAELRAEQVVAANKEEQDAINANYMEADQSGILAAIGSETDVTAYRSAMLNDNNIWYRPEDIYKNIVIRDNVRGMYFLEKGSTDTYKQMVEEQYKDE